MNKMILIFMLGFFLFFPTAAQAQQPVEMDSVQVSLWPEYDQPNVLVMYDLKFSSTLSLPANFQFRIPSAAGEPYAVAMRGTDGGLTNMTYDTRIAGDWLWITFTTPSPEVRIEYYDSDLALQGGRRSFSYTWPGDYLVHSMKIQLQQPVNASAMDVQIQQVFASGEDSRTSGMGSGRPGGDGLLYFDALIGEIPAGDKVIVSAAYEKPDDLLSFQSQPVQPSQPITPQTAGRTTITGLVPWFLGALGILLIAGGAFWYWQSGQDTPPNRKNRPTRRQKEAVVTGSGRDESGEVYCSQCGKRAGGGDQYCRACGAALRNK
ncbi:MAG: zinc ribbon domain-containing protein [Anaerolineaceae bacterium]|nr:zinc ribbon domain-containing protein [Anaerolineaceae bacterium]